MFQTSLYGPLPVTGTTTLVLSPEQDMIWDRGWQDAFRIEEDLLEHCDALGLQAPVVVLRPDRTVAFGITPARSARRT